MNFHLPPTITFYNCWTRVPGANLDFLCGSWRTKERTVVVRRVSWAEAMGAAVASRAHAYSWFSLLMQFCGVVDDLPPVHAMHPAENWAALHAGVCKTTSTDLVIYPRYFGVWGAGVTGGVTLSLTPLGLNKAPRNAYYNCSLVTVQQWSRAQFGAVLMHTSQAALPVLHWVMRKL